MPFSPLRSVSATPASTLPAVLLSAVACLLTSAALGQPIDVIDLAGASTDAPGLARVHGSTGTGSFGVPVAGGADVDGDGHEDSAVAFMTADPLGRGNAGEVDLIFGDGTVQGVVDTAVDQERVLRFFGAQAGENAGAEIWIDDVTGDGVGDLLICRQGFSGSITGQGALSIVEGGEELRSHAATLQPVDLSAPPKSLTITELRGPSTNARLGIWVRTGDVDGDGTLDLVVGADQEGVNPEQTHHGAIYVVRGGPHLATGSVHELENLATSGLAGDIARFARTEQDHHFGATCQIADLDGNGRAEVLAASTLARAGAALTGGHANGGIARGRVDILWDDNFPSPDRGAWPVPFDHQLPSVPGSLTTIEGGDENIRFGEEILGGDDLDGDGTPDLFVGDLVAHVDPSRGAPRAQAGLGYVIFGGPSLRSGPSLTFDIDDPVLPPGVSVTTIWGPNAGALGADTAAQGDFDGDGRADLAFCSPHAEPHGRQHAGAVHFFLGQDGAWPSLVDVADVPPATQLRTIELQGAMGSATGNVGDTLCYSAAVGDLDDDGVDDLLVNEMRGDGTSTNDVGNLLHFSTLGRVFDDGFESGDTTRWSDPSR